MTIAVLIITIVALLFAIAAMVFFKLKAPTAGAIFGTLALFFALADVKAYETRRAIFDGAREIDMVINIGALKSGDDCAVEYDMRAVVEAAHEEGVLVKTIIETALLTDEEKVRACLAAKRAGADFVKTSTGFAKSGATVADVALMRRTVGSEMGVKAAGGVKGISDARAMVEAGATRIGASVGVKIAQEAAGQKTTGAAAAY